MNDSTFHAVVDTLEKLIHDLQLTPSEVREAAMYACVRVESRRTVPMPVPFDANSEALRRRPDQEPR
ncbi:hypothetical protein AKJ09_00082 [Labilithrix luteola]|uniref:Uncharacterized protein n=1 Tax=Labilithrix luteola TaxID=1391654 RepID=A0A0K1PIK2_9BACT|nr:hypothetical protein [Labilithrix luteola]AKU93350.1 hypothetical protein AKJ09_00014 [Labilithrix luteola]AKU93418.1 hypothetical protein AKJ09_00082 [Labilithrix luteola]